MLLIFTGAFFSCKKETGNIVIEGQGGSGNIDLYYNDTLKALGITVNEDSLIANGLTYSLLGSANDPELGLYSNSILAQMSIFEPRADFPNTITPDSAILYIPFIEGINYYGNFLKDQVIKISELGTTVNSSNTYYQGLDYTVLGTPTFYRGTTYFNKYLTVKNNNIDMLMPPGLYVKLEADVAKRLMSLPQGDYENNESLQVSIKGFAIEGFPTDATPGNGGFAVMNMSSTAAVSDMAKVIIYYNDTSNFIFKLSSSSAVVNTGKSHGYTPAVNQQLNSTGYTNTTVYSQGGNSVKAQVQLQGLDKLAKKGKVVVNFASVKVYLKDGSWDDYFTRPLRINLLKPQDNTIRNTIIQDQRDLTNPSTLLSIGGNLNKTDNSYTFTITRQMQEWINEFADGKSTNPIVNLTIPSDNPVTGARAIFDLSKTEIKVTYAVPN